MAKKGKSNKKQGVTLERAHPNACRWPLGDPKHPDFRFCGQPADGSRPYCQHHASIAYLPRSHQQIRLLGAVERNQERGDDKTYVAAEQIAPEVIERPQGEQPRAFSRTLARGTINRPELRDDIFSTTVGAALPAGCSEMRKAS